MRVNYSSAIILGCSLIALSCAPAVAGVNSGRIITDNDGALDDYEYHGGIDTISHGYGLDGQYIEGVDFNRYDHYSNKTSDIVSVGDALSANDNLLWPAMHYRIDYFARPDLPIPGRISLKHKTQQWELKRDMRPPRPANDLSIFRLSAGAPGKYARRGIKQRAA